MIPYAREAGAVLLLIALGSSHGCVYRAGGSKARVAMAEHLKDDAVAARKLADLTRDAANKVRLAEQAKARDMAAIAAQHEQDKTDAQAKHDATVACLRDGSCRLRDHWTCPAAVPGTTASPGVSDEGARLRAESAARIIAAAAEADAQVRAAQAVIEADRK